MSKLSWLSRRDFVKGAGVAMAALATGTSVPELRADPASASAAKHSPDEILRQLMEGTDRFAKGEVVQPRRKPEDFRPLAQGQNPEAVIVACSDSRVAPEVLFDQGIGDLFVVRVAGNYVSGAGASVKGSIEYAVLELGVPLVMILGHSQCGAVKAAVQHIRAHDALPGSINDLVNNIKPAVLSVEGKPGDPLENAIRANVQRGVEKLNRMEPILEPRVKKGEVKVVGASYDLSTGRVALLAA